MSALRLMLFLAWLVIPVAAQSNGVIDLVDQSPPDSPVRLSGKIQHSETLVNGKLTVSFVDQITSKNLFDKPIIAMVVESQYSSSYSPLVLETKEFDTYFSHDLEIAPGKSYVHEHHTPKGSFSMDIPADAKLGNPHTESRVIWVQFADSTTWGDNEHEHVKALLLKREILRQTLVKLDAAATRGSDEFVKALKLSSGNPDVESIIDRIRNHQEHDGTRVAVGKVREMLDVAATRQQSVAAAR